MCLVTCARYRVIVAALALLAPLQMPSAAEPGSDSDIRAEPTHSPESAELVDLGFEGVFPKVFWEKDSFTWTVLGVSIVAAGLISYFSAGAGAPTAAGGVSTIASAVGGGGAGSYMAGMSIIGGWVGGNAMVGAAMLNGIAMGLGGGGAAYALLPALGKVGVVASVTATALDGVLYFVPPGSEELSYRLQLAVPQRLGSRDIRDLVDSLESIDSKIAQVGSENAKEIARYAPNRRDEIARELGFERDEKLEQLIQLDKAIAQKFLKTIEDLEGQKTNLLDDIRQRSQAALKDGASPEDLLVLAILSKNAGNRGLCEKLIKSIRADAASDQGYLDYLNAVMSTEDGRLKAAKDLLLQSWGRDEYSIEPPLLLVNILGHEDFKKHETAILTIVKRAEENFDDDKYKTRYSLLALYYRLGTMYFVAGRFAEAQQYYEAAYDELPWNQKYLGDKNERNLISLGIANSLFGQGKTAEAQVAIEDLLEDAKTEEDKQFIESQYAGNL